MLKDFIGSCVVLASISTMGIDIPVLSEGEGSYILAFFAFIATVYGAELILSGGEEPVERFSSDAPQPIIETMAATKEYISVQQSHRDSRRFKQAA